MTRVVKSEKLTKVVRSEKAVRIVNSKIRNFMDTTRIRFHQTPTPATNGAQLVFTLPNSDQYVSGLLEVFLDGILQTKDTDYTETTSTTFTMTSAPDADEVLRVNYVKI